MRLIAFTAKDFRRFVEPTSVKLHGDLIAFIGPNEAGKSSLLHGLALLNSDEPYGPNDRHRRSGKSPELSWILQLDDDDRVALTEIPGASSVQRVVIAKGAGGERQWAFHPAEPVRDRTSRSQLVQLIDQFVEAPGTRNVVRDPDDDFVTRLQEAARALVGLC